MIEQPSNETVNRILDIAREKMRQARALQSLVRVVTDFEMMSQLDAQGIEVSVRTRPEFPNAPKMVR